MLKHFLSSCMSYEQTMKKGIHLVGNLRNSGSTTESLLKLMHYCMFDGKIDQKLLQALNESISKEYKTQETKAQKKVSSALMKKDKELKKAQ